MRAELAHQARRTARRAVRDEPFAEKLDALGGTAGVELAREDDGIQ
jgi:hypothetical protein